MRARDDPERQRRVGQALRPQDGVPILGRWPARLAAALASPPAIALAFYLAGNGPTLAALALATLAALPLCAAVAARRAARRRASLALLALCLAFDALYIARRLDRTDPRKAALAFCDRQGCGAPPLLARLAPEGETAMAGMALTSTFGMIAGDERRELLRLLRVSYRRQEASDALAALPSAPLLGLLPRAGRFQLWMPPGVERPPCIVFLHGFGGQLSAYLEALLDAGLGERFAIVAPLGGPLGLWWRPEEQQNLLDILDALPPSIDRSRVSLVGLSNGAIGATAVATSPRFARRFHRVVALSGAGPLGQSDEPPPILFLTGAQDPRFPLPYIQQAHRALQGRGAASRLETVDGDHFIILSKNREVADLIRAWVE